MKLRYFTAVLLLPFLTVGAQQASRRQLADWTDSIAVFQERQRAVDRRLEHFRRDTLHLSGPGGVGSPAIEAHRDGRHFRRIVERNCGDTGCGAHAYYFWEDALFLAMTWSEKREPDGTLRVEAHRLDSWFYSNDRLIGWLPPDGVLRSHGPRVTDERIIEAAGNNPNAARFLLKALRKRLSFDH